MSTTETIQTALPVPPAVVEQADWLIADDRLIVAIKEVRAATGCSLAEARDWVYARARSRRPADSDRAAFTAALRELADFIDANPDLPVPQYEHDAGVHISALDGSDDERRAEVDRIAAALGVLAAATPGGHYIARRVFGGRVQYEAAMVPADDLARYHAELSYAGSVTP
jgi:hypothetical protein